MKRSPLEHVKHLIKKLPAEDRRKIITFFELPDSGLQSYDLREEFEALKKHGIALPRDGSPSQVSLIFIRDLVEVHVGDRKVLHARFFPDTFAEAFPHYIEQLELTASKYKERLFTPQRRTALRASRIANGIQETDAEFESEIDKRCLELATLWVTDKAKRIAERISRHFPGMIGDMLVAAIHGETFYDLVEAAKAFGKDIPSSQPLKKAVQDLAWRDLKPHLPSTRHSRTPEDWRDPEQLKKYAEKVNERRLLATCIKNMYEDCDHDEGWINDLKQDSNFLGLSAGIDGDTLAWAIRCVADDNLSERDRQPLSITLELARRELNLTELDVETLRNKFDAGSKAIKAERLKKNEPPSGK